MPGQPNGTGPRNVAGDVTTKAVGGAAAEAIRGVTADASGGMTAGVAGGAMTDLVEGPAGSHLPARTRDCQCLWISQWTKPNAATCPPETLIAASALTTTVRTVAV